MQIAHYRGRRVTGKEKYEQVEPSIKRVARSLLFKGCLLFVALSIFSLRIVADSHGAKESYRLPGVVEDPRRE